MNPPARAVTALKALACVLFAGHMAATCVQHIPPQSALYRAAPPFTRYLEVTGVWQSWNMFTTAPYFHSYDVALEVTHTDGTKETRGVMLPGLERYDGTLRAESFFLCAINDRDCGNYLDGYLTAVCSTLHAESGRGGQTLRMKESIERLRRIPDILDGGVIANHEEHPSKSFVCGD
jgi:hypothetical protein